MTTPPPTAPRDHLTTLDDLKAWIRAYTDTRDWAKYHHPKDLGLALAIEVGEVLEHFRYRSENDIITALRDPPTHRQYGHELADCLWMLLRLADVTGVDLSAALHEKLALTATKYPADRVRGLNHKYTHYQSE